MANSALSVNIPGYDPSKARGSYFNGEIRGRFRRFTTTRAKVIRLGNATDKIAVFAVWTRRSMSSRSATASVHVAGIAGITAAGSRLEISSEDRPILLLVEPGQFKDVDAIIPSHQKIVSIGVLDELSSKGPNATRYLRLLDATAITSGQIVVLRPERLRFPSAFQSMVWPCSAMDILQHTFGERASEERKGGGVHRDRPGGGEIGPSVQPGSTPGEREPVIADSKSPEDRDGSIVSDQQDDSGRGEGGGVHRDRSGGGEIGPSVQPGSPPGEIEPGIADSKSPEDTDGSVVSDQQGGTGTGGGGSVTGAAGPGGDATESSGTWNSKARQFAKEGHSGVDRLGYLDYADALAGLFSTGSKDVLPAAVGIYAPWGGGKSFLLDKLKENLEPWIEPRWFSTWCCCITGTFHMVGKSVLVVITWAVLKALYEWCRACERSCGSTQSVPQHDEEIGSDTQDDSLGREFIVVEFNAWECAGSDVLWASVITKIFDTVERHQAFGRGAVRAARINELLEDSSWNWCGLATFYVFVTLMGFIAVYVLHWTNAIPDISISVRWILATLVPGGLTLLKMLLKIRSRGSLGAAQSVLRKAISKRESVGDSYLGFMSDVREELEIVFGMINKYNEKKGRRKLALTVIIDDLDRCPNDKVMEMLKATHLLLEAPKAPMVVFLAVDPQLIISAIANSLDGVPNTMKALQYLDKIIHLPFCIPPISETNRFNLLECLLNGSKNSCQTTLKRLKKAVQLEPGGTDLDHLQVAPHLRKFLGTKPDLLEFVQHLNHWASMVEAGTLRPPLGALQICFDRLGLELTELEPACVKHFETLNKVINRVLDDFDRRGENSNNDVRVETATQAFVSGGESSGDGEEIPPADSPYPSGGGSHSTGESVLPADQIDVAVIRTMTPVVAAPAEVSPAVQFRGVSVEENEMFVALFEFIKGTPRKIKRVVNVYFLQRYLAPVVHAEDAEALIKWTILAEFWPFRLSCVAFAMLAVTPPETPDSREISTTAPAATVDDGPSILEVYNGSGGGQAVSTWIDRHRHKEGKVKDLLSSDDSEGRFLDAVKVGASIKRSQVIGTLLRNSFNLNPAIMSVVEVEMADTRTSTSAPRASSDLSRRAPSEVPSVSGKDSIDVILAALKEGGDATVDWGSC